MHLFHYNGKSSQEFGVSISGESTWKKPQPKMERTKVPGRNGDFITFLGAYENVNIVYHCGIEKDFGVNYTALMNFLLSSPGYNRLEDDYHSTVFRMAAIETVSEPKLRQLNRSGEFDLTFVCKPQSFLKIGQSKWTFTENNALFNPTFFAAAPMIRVYGAGVLTIGSDTVTIRTADEYTDLDCELEDAYKGDENCNANILLSGEHFPRLAPGNNRIEMSGGISSVEIMPGWWTL